MLYYRSKFLVSCTRTCRDPDGHPAVVNRYHQYRWHHRAYRSWGTGHKQQWQELEFPRRTSIRELFSPTNRSASNALTSRSNKKTAGNETKRKMEYLSTIPRVMMVTFHLWKERLIFTSEEVPASEEVLVSTAELCSVNSSLSPLLWNYEIAVTFCALCTCWHCYSFLWYCMTCLYLYVCPWSNFNGRKSLPCLERTLFEQYLENF